jgi:hypothetical protein
MKLFECYIYKHREDKEKYWRKFDNILCLSKKKRIVINGVNYNLCGFYWLKNNYTFISIHKRYMSFETVRGLCEPYAKCGVWTNPNFTDYFKVKI